MTNNGRKYIYLDYYNIDQEEKADKKLNTKFFSVLQYAYKKICCFNTQSTDFRTKNSVNYCVKNGFVKL